MCIACVTGLVSAGTTLCTAKGAAAWIDHRRRRRRGPLLNATILLTAVVGASMVPIATGGTGDDGSKAPEICLVRSP